jgi:DNA polymerase-1
MEAKKKILLVIDGNAIIHRAFHALPPLKTKKGKLVNAIYGFLLVFFKVLKEFKPDFVAATFDYPAPTFRDKLYKEYKAKRPKAPEELYQQISEIKRILKSFGVKIYEKEGFEADDIIGTIAKVAQKQQAYPSIETIIITGDLDTLQLVDENTKVYLLKKGIKETDLYDRNLVKVKLQLTPEQIPEFKALCGDPSDNIPGVPGIGKKMATKLIKDFGSLEKIYQLIEGPSFEHLSQKNKINLRIRDRLIKNKEQAFFSKKLAEIRKDVPIEFYLKDCRVENLDKEKAKEILGKYEFYSLIKRLPEIFEQSCLHSSKGNKLSRQKKLI